MESNLIIKRERDSFISSYKKDNNSLKLIAKTNRNEVYKIDNAKILKIYLKKTRWIQERLALNTIVFDSLFIPELINYGSNESNLFWIEETIVPGNPVIDLVNIYESPEIVYHIGRFHGLYHKNNIIQNADSWNDISIDEAFSFFPGKIIELNKKRIKKIYDSEILSKNLILKIEKQLAKYQSSISDYPELVLCHNDFSHRNLLAIKKNKQIDIQSLIDFELAYPSEKLSDLSRFLLDLISSDNYYICKEYLSAYKEIINLENNYSKKIYYYILSLCVEIMTWAAIGAPDYFNTILITFEKLIDKPNFYMELFET